MKSLSRYILESLESDNSKFMTIVFKDSSETGDVYDAAIGYIDVDTTLTYYVDINDSNNSWFRLTTGGKYHDTTKKNWSKKYSEDTIPPKNAEHAAELMKFMDDQQFIKSLESDSEYQEFMSESLGGEFSINNKEDLISRIVNACKKSSKFLRRLLLIIDDTISTRNISQLNESFVFERSWFAAIATNYLLYLAATNVAKISNKWIRNLLLALIAERVITTNDLNWKLKKILNL